MKRGKNFAAEGRLSGVGIDLPVKKFFRTVRWNSRPRMASDRMAGSYRGPKYIITLREVMIYTAGNGHRFCLFFGAFLLSFQEMLLFRPE